MVFTSSYNVSFIIYNRIKFDRDRPPSRVFIPVCESIDIVRFHVRPQTILLILSISILSILINWSYTCSIKCLETAFIWVFGVCESIGIVCFSGAIENEAVVAILILEILINESLCSLKCLETSYI